MKFLNHYKWAILWASLIFILCAIPGHDLPQSDWFELLRLDKWVHFAMFFTLFFLTASAWKNKNAVLTSFQMGSITLGSTLYGIGLEVMQDLVFTDRSFDLYDALANAIGAVAGLLLFAPLHSKLGKYV